MQFHTIPVEKFVVKCANAVRTEYEYTDFEAAEEKLLELREKEEQTGAPYCEFYIWAKIDA